MVYKAIGLMSGSSLDGLDIAYAHFQEIAGKWSVELKNTLCLEYDDAWSKRLSESTHLNAFDYQLLHVEFGHYLGQCVNAFIEENGLHHQVAMIASHGHTTFHHPELKMTSQLGEGAAIAAETGLAVISDLRALDVALGGQGAPIVPMGEKRLFGEYDLLLNLGGIANISIREDDEYIAFDVCSANAVLNRLAAKAGFDYDDEGRLAVEGTLDQQLLDELNNLDYYAKHPPKSLDNSFASSIIYPIIEKYGLSVSDALRTYVEHIILQIQWSIHPFLSASFPSPANMLITGGGAFNTFLIKKLEEVLMGKILIVVPDAGVVKFKEAMIMAFLGVLRWREEYTVLSSVTGATKNSIGGALWLG